MNTVTTFIKKKKKRNQSVSLLYAGSIYLGRYETLKRLCEVVRKNAINDICINIYTQEDAWNQLKSEFEKYEFVNYGGFIGQEELMTQIRESDGLLFFESFDEEILKYTKLSLSTKVPEYLSSGIPIFAVGNATQGSIKYLSDNKAAYVATDDSQIESVFLDFIAHKDVDTVLKNAKKLFHDNHEMKNQQEQFKQILQKSLS